MSAESKGVTPDVVRAARRITFSATIVLVDRSTVVLSETTTDQRSAGFTEALLPYVGERCVLVTVELDRDADSPPPRVNP